MEMTDNMLRHQAQAKFWNHCAEVEANPELCEVFYAKAVSEAEALLHLLVYVSQRVLPGKVAPAIDYAANVAAIMQGMPVVVELDISGGTVYDTADGQVLGWV